MFFSGMPMTGVTAALGQYGLDMASKPRGGLFGSGITGDQLSQALGALGGFGGQQQPIEHAQFAPMDLGPPPPQMFNRPIARRPIQPFDLSRYLQPLGTY